jgi:hypothetical protein
MKELLLGVVLILIWIVAVILIGFGNEYTMTHHPSINHNDYAYHKSE